MRRVEVNTIGEAKEIANNAKQAIIYIDQTSGRYVVEYYNF